MNTKHQDALIAAALLHKSGNGSVKHMSAIKGGRNSRTYEITTGFGTQLVLKCYVQGTMQHHNRQQAEIDFLRYCDVAGIANVPRILAWSTRVSSSLFTRVPGYQFSVVGRAPVDDDIRQMAHFINHLNNNQSVPMELQSAAEACFSISDHLKTVEGRVQRVLGIEGSTDLQKKVVRWARQALSPAWKAVCEGVIRTCSPDELTQPLHHRQICISPSDFGFHNVLVDADEELYFVDFEYAGSDDPAKLICDSILQPRTPLSKSMRHTFRRALCDALQLDSDAQRRVDLLMNVYTIKWACIALNGLAAYTNQPRDSLIAGPQDIDMEYQFSLAQALVQRAGEGQDSW